MTEGSFLNILTKVLGGLSILAGALFIVSLVFYLNGVSNLFTSYFIVQPEISSSYVTVVALLLAAIDLALGYLYLRKDLRVLGALLVRAAIHFILVLVMVYSHFSGVYVVFDFGLEISREIIILAVNLGLFVYLALNKDYLINYSPNEKVPADISAA